jgi:membrane-associated phospholipid phosphatase
MPIVIGGLILAFLVMLLFGGTELDRGLLFLFSAGDQPRLEQAAGIVSWAAGSTPLLVVTLIAAVTLFIHERRRAAVLMLAIPLGGRLLLLASQSWSAGIRPTPDERMLAWQDLFYPSAHAANATLTAFALAFLAVRAQPWRSAALAAAATFALLAGAARLVLGASWPSDVIGGWALGLAWSLLLLWLAREDLGDGTARPVRHSVPQGEHDGRESQDRDRPPDG